MPRLVANEYVYSSGAMDNCYNEYITSPPTQQLHLQQQKHEGAMQTSTLQQRKISRSQSPVQNHTQTALSSQTEDNTINPNRPKYPEHQIHSISSSEDEENQNKQVTVEEEITSVLSDGTGDFEGFDEDATLNSSILINNASREDIHNSINYLKRRFHTDFDDYREDSEGVVEAIEVEDEEIVIGDDGQIMYKSREELTPVKSQTNQYNPHTPSKRQKENDIYFNATSPTHLKTPPDQIVEINSDSTTNSQKQKRQQINKKFQLNLSQQQQNHKINNNKCSTESTSEFPVSSPSNPQQPRGGGKYPPRPPILKNTLPADSFERQLAMITACNPQMTLSEKIQTWECEDELSDVEDVNIFDDEFKRAEEQKKIDLKQIGKGARAAQQSQNFKQYDFSIFRQMIISNMKAQQNRNYYGGGQGGGMIQGGKGDETSGSESSKSIKHNDHERPSTSAVAQQQLVQQRRSKAQLNLESGETKKRIMKENPKRNQNSTTPPQTSSSDNERDCFQNSQNHTGHDKLQHSRQIHIHDKLLCPSSSEEANSQDIPSHTQLKSNQRLAQAALNNIRNKSTTRPVVKQDENKEFPKNVRCLTEEEIDSVFRLHRLNREIDKHPKETRAHPVEAEEPCLIHMRLDFANERKKSKLSLEKKQELFKTPIIPHKYLASTAISQPEIQTEPCLSPTKTLRTCEQSIKSPQPINPTNSSITPEEEKQELSIDSNIESNYEKDLEGVYHQQHEFCNYLGLTGMSTATAMANAVAELAQCNLARRSMRVLRQQQQERKDKSAKQARELKTLKMKQLKEHRKREPVGCDVPMEVEETFQKSYDGSHSQTSEPTNLMTSLKEIKKRTCNNSIPKSSAKSQHSAIATKKQPEIKILCHNIKEEAEKLSKEYVKELIQPIRETLMREVKLRKQDHPEKKDEENVAGLKEEKENDTIQEKKAKIFEVKKEIQYETKTDSLKKKENIMETPSTSKEEAAESRRRSLRSPRLSTSKSQLNVTKSRSEVLEGTKNPLEETEVFPKEQKDKIAKHELMSVECKIDSEDDNRSVTKRLETKRSSSTFLEVEDTIKAKTKEINAGSDITLTDTDKHLVGTPSYMLQHKIQMALEESRKSKPSIFIVQSLESNKEHPTKTVISTDTLVKMDKNSLTPSADLNPLTSQIKKSFIELKPIKKATTKFNKKDLKKVFKTRNGKKRRTSSFKKAPKRQLRKRKIIVINTTKPKAKLYEKSKEILRELRSSPKSGKAKLMTEESSSRKAIQNLRDSSNEIKSYRTVHTETKDLETYLDANKSQTKTRLMAKTSTPLARSRRMSLRGSTSNIKSKLSTKVRRSKHSLRTARIRILKPKPNVLRTTTQNTSKDNTKYKSLTSPESRENIVSKTETEVQTNITALNLLDNENVVVSSTTNTYDERPSSHHHHHGLLTQSSPALQIPAHNSAPYAMVSSPLVETKEQFTQSNIISGTTIRYLNSPPSSTQTMHNPLKSEYGVVLHIYYEVDILIVIQERLVSFWKCSKLINILSSLPPNQHQPQNKVFTGHHSSTSASLSPKQNNADVWCHSHSSPLGVRQPASSSSLMETSTFDEWIQLGELRRLNLDFEISVPFANRLCLHNSIPIYLEMRARQLPKNHRDCNLLSMYINIYYYHDEDMVAKCNSIQLDTIQSDIKSVNYTTLVDSRYFIMTWPRENLLGKTRSGICKYSLTPQLDSLASIREFKSLRHTIRYLDCISDDKLIGFGETQVTIWDHRSGDVIMNYDLEISVGKNLGSVYLSSQDIEQNNMLILYQYRDFNNDTPPELMTIASTITHTQPSYRVLQQFLLPTPAFKIIKSAINTGDFLVLTGQTDEEIWISTTNPTLVTLVSTQKNKRFYNRERSQLIELTEKTLNVDSLANHVLQLAAGLALSLNSKN